uniref:Hexose carrier protein HEX6 n=1 Tax=Solanum tuberosum TaxID=4113 RepID=M1B505_SOLTU
MCIPPNISSPLRPTLSTISIDKPVVTIPTAPVTTEDKRDALTPSPIVRNRIGA